METSTQPQSNLLRQTKLPFDIDAMLELIEEAVASYRKAALFELAERGFNSPFEILVACIISIRTFDETTVPTAIKLFSHARTPEEMSKLSPEQIDELISASTFHGAKSKQLHQIAMQVVHEFNGSMPCDFKTLTNFHGVGPKCANLTLGIACEQATAQSASGIGVDIHVHRVTNRWGYISAKTPEKSMVELSKILPKEHWVLINALLVPFGKHICTRARPHCSKCPVLKY